MECVLESTPTHPHAAAAPFVCTTAQARVTAEPKRAAGPRYHHVEVLPWEGGPDKPIKLKIKAGYLAKPPSPAAAVTDATTGASAVAAPSPGLGNAMETTSGVRQGSPPDSCRSSADGSAVPVGGTKRITVVGGADGISAEDGWPEEYGGTSRPTRRVVTRKASKAAQQAAGRRDGSCSGVRDDTDNGRDGGDEEGAVERGCKESEVARGGHQAGRGKLATAGNGRKKDGAVEADSGEDEMVVDEEERGEEGEEDGQEEQEGEDEEDEEEDEQDGEAEHEETAMKAADGEVCFIPVGTRVVVIELPKWSEGQRGGPKPNGKVKVDELLGKTVSVMLVWTSSSI